jgi:hypothetical protein
MNDLGVQHISIRASAPPSFTRRKWGDHSTPRIPNRSDASWTTVSRRCCASSKVLPCASLRSDSGIGSSAAVLSPLARESSESGTRGGTARARRGRTVLAHGRASATCLRRPERAARVLRPSAVCRARYLSSPSLRRGGLLDRSPRRHGLARCRLPSSGALRRDCRTTKATLVRAGC